MNDRLLARVLGCLVALAVAQAGAVRAQDASQVLPVEPATAEGQRADAVAPSVPDDEPAHASAPRRGEPLSPSAGTDEDPDAVRFEPRKVDVSWSNGFVLRTLDDQFELRVLGIVQADAVGYLDHKDGLRDDDLYIRRARLYVEGRSFKFVDYRLMTDFGREGPAVLDGYADIHMLRDVVRLRAGKFKQPFSYEQFVMEDRTLAMFERSLIDQLSPARNVGFMLHGEVAGMLRYAFSVADGTRNGDNDEPHRKSKDLVGRFDVRPFARVAQSAWKRLLVGLSVQWGKETDKWNPGVLKTPLEVQWFQFKDDVNNRGTRLRVSPELYYFRGPFGMGGQYLYQAQQVQALGSPRADVHFQGGFGMVSLVLTGEPRSNYAMFIDPARTFDPRDPWHAPGAFELIARVSTLKVGSEAFAARYGLVDVANVSRAAHELTLGLNWYLNRYTWFMFDYERDWYLDALATPRALRKSDEVAGRVTVMW